MDADEFQGLAKHAGGGSPTSSPHLCAYYLHGASEAQCVQVTSNLNRNVSGCCGTKDSRSFPPCNSQWRKCIECLKEGCIAQAGRVVDVARGLCEKHAATRVDTGTPESTYRVAPRRVPRFEPSLPASNPVVTQKTITEFVRIPPKLPEEPAPAKSARTTVFDAESDDGMIRLDEPQKPERTPVSSDRPSRTLSEEELVACVQRYERLSVRSREALGYLVRGEQVPGWSATSMKTKKSDLLTYVGIPRGRNRIEMMVQVLERSVVGGGRAQDTPPEAPTGPPGSPEPPVPPREEEPSGADILNGDFDLNKSVERYQGLTTRAKETAVLLANGQHVPGISPQSEQSTKSALCNSIGIPKGRRRGSLGVRLELLRRVITRHDELQAMTPTRRAVEVPPNAMVTDNPREIGLLTHFRLLSEIEQEQVEQMLKSLYALHTRSGR